MADQSDSIDRRDSMCPSGHATRAVAISTQVSNGVETVQYQCPTCGHKWTVIRSEKQPPGERIVE